MNNHFFTVFFVISIIVIIPNAYAEYDDTIVVMETNSGKLIFEFFPDVAPNHVTNFVELSREGFYTDTMFHRIIEGFMIQGGDPQTKDGDISTSLWGTGSPGFTIDSEFNNIKHNRGILSMARSADPNSAGSQFFIIHEDSHFLNGQYTAFGRIISDESFETLDRLATVDTLHSVTDTSGNAIGDQPMNPAVTAITKVDIITRSEISGLSELLPPETTDVKPMQTGGGKYTNMDYGVSFTTPQGWLIQTPTLVDANTPNIVVAGPKVGNISPTLTVTIKTTTDNLQQNIQEFKNEIQPLIDQGVILIEKESPYRTDNFDGHLMLSTANFENKDNEILKLGFASVLFVDNDRFYVLQYMNTAENFPRQQILFGDMLTSFEIFSTLSVNSEDNISMEEWKEQTDFKEGGGCLIATAAFGSEIAPQVQFLREIRDNTVMTTQSGTAFMTGFNQFYYSFSPYVADYERENPVFKEVVKVTLTPLLASLTLLNYVDVDTEAEMLSYGIGIILLNIGIYFVVPAVAIITIKNRIK